AKQKLDNGEYPGAVSALTRILETDPRNKEALNLRGEARMGLEDYYGAIGDFNFALESDSAYVEALNNRGEAKMYLGDDEGAIADFDRVIALAPGFADA